MFQIFLPFMFFRRRPYDHDDAPKHQPVAHTIEEDLKHVIAELKKMPTKEEYEYQKKLNQELIELYKKTFNKE